MIQMHDAHEAFTGDLVTPLKARLPRYVALEERAERSVLARYGIAYPLHPCVKKADLRALMTERRDLMPPDDPDGLWDWAAGIEPWAERIWPRPPRVVRGYFLARYQELTT